MRITRLLLTVGCLVQLTVLQAQSFSTEFSTEIQKADGKIEMTPQLKGIFELPLKRAWTTEWELASSQAGLDIRIDARKDFGPFSKHALTLGIIGGFSSGDACMLFFADLGLSASWKSLSCCAVFHYAPLSPLHDKYLEIAAQYDFGTLYIQGGVNIQHTGAGSSGTLSFIGVLTVGICLNTP